MTHFYFLHDTCSISTDGREHYTFVFRNDFHVSVIMDEAAHDKWELALMDTACRVIFNHNVTAYDVMDDLTVDQVNAKLKEISCLPKMTIDDIYDPMAH